MNLDPLDSFVERREGRCVIRKILIASNGMAAAKAMHSWRRWTLQEFQSAKLITFVAMATRDDLNANADFIRLADACVEVPGGKSMNNYTNVDLICRIAQEQKVDAVWPGWGHASTNAAPSTNAALPAKLQKIGITFIGPSSGAMAALGDKIAANIFAQTAKVPSIPWSGDGLFCELIDGQKEVAAAIRKEVVNKAMVTSAEEACARAEKIGYPIMVKASEGGGGKGVRKATNMEELAIAFSTVFTEVPGSPIFLMKMMPNARHLEIQVVGDEHGNTLALNGRDCSTQRRFQKILDEGPPTIAKPNVLREMERAAMHLTALVGYRGAGTVEYLYSPETDTFCFLELNPSLQVGHPVTESITGVNMPAAQLQIAMGVPLHNIPDIRKFYGMDPSQNSKIDFLAVDYPPITSHCCASRITAENPDEGFKPTSGKILSVRFQSSGDCWGYFSCGSEGVIHEFADCQVGHIFAQGPNREAARQSLEFALMNMDIQGSIRHPVDYLVDLVASKEYRENTIDTTWLDGLIANRFSERNKEANVKALEVESSHGPRLKGVLEDLGYATTASLQGSSIADLIASLVHDTPTTEARAEAPQSLDDLRQRLDHLEEQLQPEPQGVLLQPALFDWPLSQCEKRDKLIQILDLELSATEHEHAMVLKAMAKSKLPFLSKGQHKRIYHSGYRAGFAAAISESSVVGARKM